MDQNELIIHSGATVCDAMRKIDKSDYKILFVADGGKLVGTLTDGDIRRFLFKGGTLQDRVDRAANRNPKAAHNLKQASELYNRLYYIAIPVLDEEGRIVDLYLGEELQTKKKRQICARICRNAVAEGKARGNQTEYLSEDGYPSLCHY